MSKLRTYYSLKNDLSQEISTIYLGNNFPSEMNKKLNIVNM